VSHFGGNLLPAAVSEPAIAICLNSLMSNMYVVISFMQMEVEEEKQHEGIQQYYITKIEALQVTCGNWAISI